MSGCNCVTNDNSDCCHHASADSFDSFAARDSFFHDHCPHRTRREALLRKQVASGQFNSVEAAIQTVLGHHASHALKSLLDKALQHMGRRVPVPELRQKQN